MRQRVSPRDRRTGRLRDRQAHGRAATAPTPPQGSAARKAEQLCAAVGEAGACGELASMRCPLPLDPTVMLDGVIASECGVFKSALSPLRLTFRTLGARAPGCARAGVLMPAAPP
jgi:hypothetical protein